MKDPVFDKLPPSYSGFRVWFDTETSYLSGQARLNRKVFSEQVRDFLLRAGTPAYLETPQSRIHRYSQLLEFSAIEHQGRGVLEGGASALGVFSVAPQFRLSKFSRRLFQQNFQEFAGFQVADEPEALRRIFGRLESLIEQKGRVSLIGWNPMFDISFLQTAVQRYPELQQYHSFLPRMMQADRLRLVAAEEAVFRATAKMAETSPYFRRFLGRKLPGAVAQQLDPEKLRFLPFWSIHNIVSAIRNPDTKAILSGSFHTAAKDADVARELYLRFNMVWQDVGTTTFQQRMEIAGLLAPGEKAEDFFVRLFQNVKDRPFQRAEETVSRLAGSRPPGGTPSGWKTLAIAAGGAALLAGGYGLYSWWKGRRQQLEADEENQEGGFRFRAATSFGLAGAALFAAHRLALKNIPNYGARLYQALSTFEEYSPGRLGRVFRGSVWASQFVPSQLVATADDIVLLGSEAAKSGARLALTPLGEHLQRLAGESIDLASLPWHDPGFALRFVRETPESKYLRMFAGETPTDISVSFARAGISTATSARYGAPTSQAPLRPAVGSPLETLRAAARSKSVSGYRGGLIWDLESGSQILSDAAKALEELPSSAITFQPLKAVRQGARISSYAGQASQKAFGLAERVNQLLNQVGAGIHPGSYSTATQLLTQLAFKRVLPVAAAYTGLRFLDYLTGKVVSGLFWDAYAKARILHAEMTDKVPGWRSAVEFNRRVLPGPAYAPLALPLSGALIGGAVGYIRLARSGILSNPALRKAAFYKHAGIGALAGFALALPFLPGMLGSRRTADEWREVFSGEQPVPVRSGRWWDLSGSFFGGGRIKMWRPHRYVLHKTGAVEAGIYGSEEEYWERNPLIHPIRWFKDPNWLARKRAEDRPYPVTSPAFSNVPIIGPLLAATIGKIVAPPVRMHEGEWREDEYTLFSKKVEPRGPDALPPKPAKEEFGFFRSLGHTLRNLTDLVGLPGFFARSLWKNAELDQPPDPELAGSRMMTSLGRRFYQQELGAITGVTPEGDLYGFSEPVRRFIQREEDFPRVNEIPNRMPDWLPGSEYMIDFRKGDPYAKIPYGEIRLPGPGYEALHPELKGVKPEDYPDIHKLRILADVAPWSVEFSVVKSRLEKNLESLPEKERIEFQRAVDRARQTRESVRQFARTKRGETSELEGTIAEVSDKGFRLKEYPGRLFRLSGIRISAAEMSAEAIGEANRVIKESLAVGKRVRLVVEKGAEAGDIVYAAVKTGSGKSLNRELLERRLAVYDDAIAGPEAMEGASLAEKAARRYAEIILTRRDSLFNPFRYVPMPGARKFAPAEDPVLAYERERMNQRRRWDRPVKDFLKPWSRLFFRALTGRAPADEDAALESEVDQLKDYLEYLRGLRQAAYGDRGGLMRMARTLVGGEPTSSPEAAAKRLPEPDRSYFEQLVQTRDEKLRKRILRSASPQLSAALRAQWAKEAARRKGEPVPELGPEGTPVTEEDIRRAKEAGITAQEAARARTIARFFASRKLRLPLGDARAEGSVLSPDIDYEDLKIKILAMEGKDLRDYRIYQDRISTLWRKPYLDGALRELTSGSRTTEEEARRLIERAIANVKRGRTGQSASVTEAPAIKGKRRVEIRARKEPDDDLRREVRRNPELYR